MVEINVTKTERVSVAYLKVDAGVRYWEDGTINGEPDSDDAPRVPFAVDGRWIPVIRLADGVVLNWPEGVTADIHYKVCDDGNYELLSEDMSSVVKIDDYVPAILAPEGDGFGDYIIMKIDGAGKIDKWKVKLEAFGAKKADD